jgi:hypothetical protein
MAKLPRQPVVLPDLSLSMDGHLGQGDFTPLTQGGASLRQIAQPFDIPWRTEMADQQVDPPGALPRPRRRRHPLLDLTVNTPDFFGSMENGYSAVIESIIEQWVAPTPRSIDSERSGRTTGCRPKASTQRLSHSISPGEQRWGGDPHRQHPGFFWLYGKRLQRGDREHHRAVGGAGPAGPPAAGQRPPRSGSAIRYPLANRDG